MSEEKSWMEMAVAILAGGGFLAFLQWLFGGRRKENSESEKTTAETEAVKLEIKIKKEDYYEKKFNEAMIIIEKFEEKNRRQAEEIEQQKKDIQSLKRMITMLKIQVHQE